MKLRYTPEAIADLQEIKTYIRDTLHNPTAAKRISKMILDSCAHLKAFPNKGVDLGAVLELETNLHMLVCKSYAVIYCCEDDTVSISRVFNSLQDFMRLLFGIDIFESLN